RPNCIEYSVSRVAWRAILPPFARIREAPGPDSFSTCTRGELLGQVVGIRDGEAVRNHDRAEVPAISLAVRERPAIFVLSLWRAGYRRPHENGREVVARDAAAGPLAPVVAPAGLVQLRGVDADEPDTLLAQPEAVAVRGPGHADKTRR